MILRTTGDIREIANSAWVSTTDEIKVRKKSDQEVERVVSFLITNSHTSPLEVMSISLHLEADDTDEDFEVFYIYAKNKYARLTPDPDQAKLTIDLLNFTKETYKNNLWLKSPFLLFEKQHLVLSRMLKDFREIPDTSSSDVDLELGNHGMSVELINFHDESDLDLSRATWRIRCPLSISLQLVRHRSGSYNQSSGRYRTLNYSIAPLSLDVMDISNRAGVKLSETFSETQKMVEKYLEIMKDLKVARDSGSINNDEYKRVRECARFILPEGRMTELYATFYLSDFYDNYKKLRDSVHAQKEHVYIAQKMHQTLDAVRNSKHEIEVTSS